MRECTAIHESQFGFMPGRSTTDATFILKQTIEQYREGQKDICVTFIDLEKAYDRVPREEIWRTMRERLVPEKYVKLAQDMYTGCRTKVRTGAGESSKFNVDVGLHQGSALSPYLFLILMDVLTERVRKEAQSRRHRVVRRQGCGHDRVPGVVEESLGREGNAGQ